MIQLIVFSPYVRSVGLDLNKARHLPLDGNMGPIGLC